MQVLIRPVSDLKLTIAGQELPGTFHLVSEWEGFAKFASTNPPRFIVVGGIKKPGSIGGLVGSIESLLSHSSPLAEVIQGLEAQAVQVSTEIQNELAKTAS